MTGLELDPQSVIVGKILLAAFLGFLIGSERALVARQAAGMRTFALVSLGSCIFILTGVAATAPFVGLVNFDPTRILAAIIQGIGFLGAGLIVFKTDGVHGITTAAGLWVAAGIGALVALGQYEIAAFCTFLVLSIFFGMWYVEQYFKHWFADESADAK